MGKSLDYFMQNKVFEKFCSPTFKKQFEKNAFKVLKQLFMYIHFFLNLN